MRYGIWSFNNMKAKLLPLDIVIKNAGTKTTKTNEHRMYVYHSSNGGYLNIYNPEDFGKVIDIEEQAKNEEVRIFYRGKYNIGAYYHEWFEWIGEEPIMFKLSDELWDMEF